MRWLSSGTSLMSHCKRGSLSSWICHIWQTFTAVAARADLWSVFISRATFMFFLIGLVACQGSHDSGTVASFLFNSCPMFCPRLTSWVLELIQQFNNFMPNYFVQMTPPSLGIKRNWPKIAALPRAQGWKAGVDLVSTHVHLALPFGCWECSLSQVPFYHYLMYEWYFFVDLPYYAISSYSIIIRALRETEWPNLSFVLESCIHLFLIRGWGAIFVS